MANLFIRTYTFVDGTTAYGSQVEAEVGNIVNVLNNLNTAVSTWGQVSISNAVGVPLVADCAAGSQDIADFKNNSITKLAVASTGAITGQSTLTLTPTSNQIVLGTTRTITISAGTPASSSRTVTIPDPGTAAEFVLSEATSTINGVKTFAGQLIGKGTTTNDSAAAGYIGEQVISTVLRASGINAFGTGTYGDVTTFSLTAGDYDVKIDIGMQPGTTQTGFDFGLGTTAGNVAPAADYGLQMWQVFGSGTTLDNHSNAYLRISVASTTTYRLKAAGFYTAGTPKFYGSINARRVR